jgi:predicted O-methyltransferase YrrM
LYPAAGILTAVLEAVRQYVDKDTISYIELQDVHITRPIIFSAPDNEIRTRLRLRSIAGGGDIYEFRHFFQKANDEWELNCTGTVHFGTLSLDRDSSLGFPDDTEKVNSTFRSLYNECCLKCFIEPEPDRLYSRLSSVGLEFGPWFQNLVHIAKGRSLANATVEIPRTSDCMPSGFEQDMLIHPVVLDGLVQLGLNTSREAHEEPGVTMVPVAFKRVRISTATQRAPGTRIVGYSTLRDSAIGVKVDVVASDDRWKEPWILLEGLEFAMLSGTPSSVSISEASVPRKLASRLEWKLDIKYTPKAIIHKSCEDSVTDLTVEEERPQLESLLHDLQRGALICIQRVLQACPLSDVAPSPSHLRTLHQAMTRIYRENSSMGTLISSNQQAHDQVLQRVADYSIDGEIMHHHCQYLDQVLRGKIHSLQVLLEDGRLNRWYAEGITWRANHAKISAYLRLYAHKHPKANILEIGGGTGGLTLSALQAMTMPDGSALFDSYCFTDISGAFFEKAQQKFKHWVHSMKFTVLDIEKDIHEQGFEDGKFDLILADNVLHATKSIYQTLSSVKKLLKPYLYLFSHPLLSFFWSNLYMTDALTICDAVMDSLF